MSTTVTKSSFVEAPPEKVSAIILDLDSYPSWQKEVQKVDIVSTDDEGRPLEAKFSMSSMGQHANYTLAYSYADNLTVATRLTDGDLITKLDQLYELLEVDGGTEVRYSLDMDVKWQVPEFIIKSIVSKGVRTNLEGIKSRGEL